MQESYDQSHLDRKYFIDPEKYNCPFCNRRSITYSVIGEFQFGWGQERTVYGYLVQCGGNSCQKVSMHLTDHNFSIFNNKFSYYFNDKGNGVALDGVELDKLFFYHQPTTFFTLDSRINEKVRKLVAEAEGCAKMNYLVGASGCLRKGIYELLELEQVPKKDAGDNELDYGDRIKVLKSKYPMVPPEYFDALANIQGMTSEQLHEGDWKPWSSDEFRFLVETVKEVLTEVYVRPQDKASVLQKILALKPQKNAPKTQPKEETTQSQ